MLGDPSFSRKLAELIEACGEVGLPLKVGCALRTPDAQAQLWCRSRSNEEVEIRRRVLEPLAPRIASLLKDEYAGLGPEVTTHLPGDSWHQWGEAADVYVLVGSVAVWDGSTVKHIAEAAEEVGLCHSFTYKKSWLPKRRQWHVQLRNTESPLRTTGLAPTWSLIEREMVARFGESLGVDR